jgi:heme/copper-type cytochrome/quinol oxidase subunit 2
MGFTVRVVTRAEYDAWIEATRPKEEPAAIGPMTGVVYTDLVVVAQP